ncbi:MAG TPA: ATP-dependent DNA ligase [Candidatus Limnocylindrales bacterium]|nr:ATP-dependent DNA ligase [Candidatus Limnocylindrales bacterium]
MLAVEPPIAPMLARLTRELPAGPMTYEPKWDGFRCLAWVDAAAVELRSRHDRPLARYFPEVVGALRAALAGTDGAVLDGELIVDERSDLPAAEPAFERLMRRLHPAASRVERLSAETPARFVAFDVLAIGSEDLRGHPFVERRQRLERLLAGAGDARVGLTPATRDPDVAERWLEGALGPGVDGVVAKPDAISYEPGRRTMIKVKRLRTADCVLAGIRVAPGPAVSSLLLGLYDAADELRHVGAVIQLPVADRIALVAELEPLAVSLDDHPWRDGFAIGRSPLGRLPGSAARWTPDMDHDWVPLRPERVVEVGFDQVDGDRFRHPARFVRWRPDREATSCRLDQITGGVRVPVAP